MAAWACAFDLIPAWLVYSWLSAAVFLLCSITLSVVDDHVKLNNQAGTQ